MLSEDLQDRIGGDETAKTGVPHGSQVFAGGFVQFNRERSFTLPCRLTIRRQARCKGLGIGQTAGLNLKRQRPHREHRDGFTLLLRAWGGSPILARSSWQPLVR